MILVQTGSVTACAKMTFIRLMKALETRTNNHVVCSPAVPCGPGRVFHASNARTVMGHVPRALRFKFMRKRLTKAQQSHKAALTISTTSITSADDGGFDNEDEYYD